MTGNVFQCHEEACNPSQFNRMLKVLECYANKMYTSAQDLQMLFDEMKVPKIEQPTPLSNNGSEIDKQIFNLKLKKYVDREDTLLANLRALFAVIWGQCSLTMKTKLKTNKDLTKWKSEANCAALLKEIQRISLQYKLQKDLFMMLHCQLQEFYRYCQKDGQTLHQYLEVFNLMTSNIEEYGGSITYHDVF